MKIDPAVPGGAVVFFNPFQPEDSGKNQSFLGRRPLVPYRARRLSPFENGPDGLAIADLLVDPVPASWRTQASWFFPASVSGGTDRSFPQKLFSLHYFNNLTGNYDPEPELLRRDQKVSTR